MSTNSSLNVQGCKRIYCHFDGYPSYMLPMLNENYNTLEKAMELVQLGNLSSVRERVKPEIGEVHNFEHPVKDITIAYHRDRGEDLEYSSSKEYYNYVFEIETNKWHLK